MAARSTEAPNFSATRAASVASLRLSESARSDAAKMSTVSFVEVCSGAIRNHVAPLDGIPHQPPAIGRLHSRVSRDGSNLAREILVFDGIVKPGGVVTPPEME